MKQTIGLAMYTIHQQAAQDLRGSLARLRDMGYGAIEFYGNYRGFDAGLVREALAESGLALTGWHIEWADLAPGAIDATAAYLKQVGCPVAVNSCLGGRAGVAHTPQQESEELWHGYINDLNAMARALAGHGLRLGYHNHDHEFSLQYGGRRVHDILFEALLPDIIMELDSGCCIQGGADPAEVVRKNRGRDMFLHAKPYSKTRGFPIVIGDADDAHDWPGLLAALDEHCLGILVEHGGAEGLDGMQTAQACLQGLERMMAP